MGRRDDLAANVLFVALQQLWENGGGLHIETLRKKVEKNAKLTAWDKEILPHGPPRWLSALERYSHEYVKSGLLIKSRGIWRITDLGASMLDGNSHDIFDIARTAYESWRHKHNK